MAIWCCRSRARGQKAHQNRLFTDLPPVPIDLPPVQTTCPPVPDDPRSDRGIAALLMPLRGSAVWICSANQMASAE